MQPGLLACARPSGACLLHPVTTPGLQSGGSCGHGTVSDPTFHPQFHPSMAQQELPVPIYVTRGEGQRLDNAQTLHGELGGGPGGRGGHGAEGRCLTVLPDLP